MRPAGPSFALRRPFFEAKEREVARYGDLSASIFRYETGVEAVRLRNPRGEAVVLPFLGQMLWSAAFDGVSLAMQSMFAEPRPASTIVETYGCLAYHAGLLRNGVPGPGDTHATHGEAPCAPMDAAGVLCGEDARGRFIALTGQREYAMGFGAHYLAEPSVRLYDGETSLDMTMRVKNLSEAPMELMYMAHVNFAFCEGARIVQPVPFDREHVIARTANPSHVVPTESWSAFLADVAANPARMQTLNEPRFYDPEIVFYLKGAKPQADGRSHYALLRREGDAFSMRFDPKVFNHTVRWIMANADQKVAAFALPSTCEPEGYTAEKRKGNVRTLNGGDSATFTTEIGYVSRDQAAQVVQEIEGTKA